MRPTRRLASAWRISLWRLLIELGAVTLPALRRGLVHLLGLVRSPNDSFEVTPCEHAPFKPSLVLPLHVTLRRERQGGIVTMIARSELKTLRELVEEVRTARRFGPRTPFQRSALGAGRTHSSSEVLMVASLWSGGITADRRATRRGSRCPSSTWWTRIGLSQSSTSMIRRSSTECEQAAGRVMAVAVKELGCDGAPAHARRGVAGWERGGPSGAAPSAAHSFASLRHACVLAPPGSGRPPANPASWRNRGWLSCGTSLRPLWALRALLCGS